MINHKNFLLKDIDLKNGIVTYNEFDINPDISFEEQIWSFKEDILQIEFVDDKYLIDIGWYPEFDPNGAFTIKVVNDFDWSNPIFKGKCKNIDLLKMYLQEAINFVVVKI